MAVKGSMFAGTKDAAVRLALSLPPAVISKRRTSEELLGLGCVTEVLAAGKILFAAEDWLVETDTFSGWAVAVMPGTLSDTASLARDWLIALGAGVVSKGAVVVAGVLANGVLSAGVLSRAALSLIAMLYTI